MLTVSAIGSCRIHTPIRLLARGRIRTDHQGAEWYTHSTRDALQKLKIVRGQLQIPDELVPLIAETHEQKWNPGAHRPDFYGATDVFVIEICSRKIASYEGIYFQQWPARMVMTDPDQHGVLASYVEKAKHRLQSEGEIMDDLDRLCTRLAKPVVFVSHVNVKMTDGRPFPDRRLLRDLLEAFSAADSRATFFDPTPVVLEFGEEGAMLDSGHYREEFYSVLAKKLLAAVEAAAEGGKDRLPEQAGAGAQAC